MVQEWEYHIEVIPETTRTIDIENSLRAMGICGWRLVAVVGERHYFVRPR